MGTRPAVIIACDVDPRLKDMANRAEWNVWDVLDFIPSLENALGSELPPISWMIRSDDSMRELTGSYTSCLTARPGLWDRLRARGHELGWHFHHWSYGDHRGFDPHPAWLPDAYEALAAHFPVRATRTGWDYCNTNTFRALDTLNVDIDLSALPGYLVWVEVESESFMVDWRRSPYTPYHPSHDNYQRAGPHPLRLIEVPISSFRASTVNAVRRAGWRIINGVWSIAGITAKVRYLTDEWNGVPRLRGDVIAVYFHPDNLADAGIKDFVRNIGLLRRHFDPEFLTASGFVDRIRSAPTLSP